MKLFYRQQIARLVSTTRTVARTLCAASKFTKGKWRDEKRQKWGTENQWGNGFGQRALSPKTSLKNSQLRFQPGELTSKERKDILATILSDRNSYHPDWYWAQQKHKVRESRLPALPVGQSHQANHWTNSYGSREWLFYQRCAEKVLKKGISLLFLPRFIEYFMKHWARHRGTKKNESQMHHLRLHNGGGWYINYNFHKCGTWTPNAIGTKRKFIKSRVGQ